MFSAGKPVGHGPRAHRDSRPLQPGPRLGTPGSQSDLDALTLVDERLPIPEQGPMRLYLTRPLRGLVGYRVATPLVDFIRFLEEVCLVWTRYPSCRLASRDNCAFLEPKARLICTFRGTFATGACEHLCDQGWRVAWSAEPSGGRWGPAQRGLGFGRARGVLFFSQRWLSKCWIAVIVTV